MFLLLLHCLHFICSSGWLAGWLFRICVYTFSILWPALNVQLTRITGLWIDGKTHTSVEQKKKSAVSVMSCVFSNIPWQCIRMKLRISSFKINKDSIVQQHVHTCKWMSRQSLLEMHILFLQSDTKFNSNKCKKIYTVLHTATPILTLILIVLRFMV